MKKDSLSLPAVLLVLAMPLIYLAFVYNSLPPSIAMHFGFDGKPDRFGSKTELIASVLFLTVTSAGSYFLVTNIYKIDPKKSAKFSADSMKKITLAVLILLTALNIMTIYAAVKGGFVFTKLLLPFLGLFFAYLGNVMYSVKQNYFVGIRTPWTLENEDVWRKTHQLGGKLWFAGGLLIALVTLLLNNAASFVFFICMVVFIALIPVVYSYILFKKAKN